MIVVLGATGHVGRSVVSHLIRQRQPVLAVAHSEKHAADLRTHGAEVAMVDVSDSDALRAAFKRGKRAFLLNPPAAPSTDTDEVEQRTIHSIASALKDTRLEKVVVESTYGAQPGEAIGDLSVLFDFERLVSAHGIPTAINRGAYYYSNFDSLLAVAGNGKLPSMFPPTLRLPMVAPADLGDFAARRLLTSVGDIGVHHVEGPTRYSFADVADAFAAALGQRIEVETTPRSRWEEAFQKQGFSPEAARSYARMTAVSVDGGFEEPADFHRGAITLEGYVHELVKNSHQ